MRIYDGNVSFLNKYC